MSIRCVLLNIPEGKGTMRTKCYFIKIDGILLENKYLILSQHYFRLWRGWTRRAGRRRNHFQKAIYQREVNVYPWTSRQAGTSGTHTHFWFAFFPQKVLSLWNFIQKTHSHFATITTQTKTIRLTDVRLCGWQQGWHSKGL